MSKKVFDVNLYKDGLRQIRVIGLLTALILVLECVLIPIGVRINLNEGYYGASMVFDLWEIHPALIMIPVYLTPVSILGVFQFMTKRNGSDFYHSIPNTRRCIYISFMAAVMTWALFLQWGTLLLSLGVNALIGSWKLQLARIMMQSLGITVVTVLVAGAMALAVSLTGTLFTNLIVALLILFGPRVLMLVLQQAVGSSIEVIATNEYMTFLGNEWNMVTGPILGMFVGNLPFEWGFHWPSILYTLGLGIFYLLAADQFMNRRSSEVAGKPAYSSKVQMLFRLAPSFMFCLIPDVVIYMTLSEEDTFTGSMVFLMGILYLVAVLLYFLYELVTTRKLKSLVKAIPGLGILLALNLLMIFGMYSMERQALAFRPEPEEISSIVLADGRVEQWYGNERSTYGGYLSSRVAQVEIENQEMKKLVSQRLKDAIDGIDQYGNYKYSQKIGIRCGNKMVYRRIRFTDQDLRSMAEAFNNEPEIQSVYMNLPDSNDPNLSLSIDSVDTSIEKENFLKQLYDTLKEDIQDMGFVEWYKCCSSSEDGYGEYDALLHITYTEGVHITASSLPIGPNTPKAYDLYRDFLREQGEAQLNMLIDQYKMMLKEQKNGNIEMNYESIGFTVDDNYYEGTVEEMLPLLESLVAMQEKLESDSHAKNIDLNLDVSFAITNENPGTPEELTLFSEFFEKSQSNSWSGVYKTEMEINGSVTEVWCMDIGGYFNLLMPEDFKFPESVLDAVSVTG